MKSDHQIILKEVMNEEDYKSIKELKNICQSRESVNLKLELDFKQTLPQSNTSIVKTAYEYFYYIKDTLVSYLGICSFGGNCYELNGLTHPDYRRMGLFKKLFSLAASEAKHGKHKELLLLTDNKSASGTSFIKAVGGTYAFSEYRMRLTENFLVNKKSNVTLRKAVKEDFADICNQNSIYFNSTLEEDALKISEDTFGNDTFMIEKEGIILGKINIDVSESYGFIYGFGILPDKRGQGYGKAALLETIQQLKDKNISEIELDVEAKNDRALKLYTDCGFRAKSSMDYYKYFI